MHNIVYIFMQISRFQRSWGMDPSFMPSRRSFERAGWSRYSPQFWFYCLQQQTIGLLTFKSSKERWMKVVTSQLMAVTLSHSQFEVSTWWNFPTGPFDIARALEKWGGLRQVSRLLSLKVRRQRSRQGKLAKALKVIQADMHGRNFLHSPRLLHDLYLKIQILFKVIHLNSRHNSSSLEL